MGVSLWIGGGRVVAIWPWVPAEEVIAMDEIGDGSLWRMLVGVACLG
jgi:hypothetical protein